MVIFAIRSEGNNVPQNDSEGNNVPQDDGFTEEAEALMREKGVLWSAREDLDNLLKSVGLRQLPNIADEQEGMSYGFATGKREKVKA